MQLLRFFVVMQPVANRLLASRTSPRSCVEAPGNGTFQEPFKHYFAAKLIHPGSPAKGLPIPPTFAPHDQTTKPAFYAHRPRPPQTPAPSF